MISPSSSFRNTEIAMTVATLIRSLRGLTENAAFRQPPPAPTR